MLIWHFRAHKVKISRLQQSGYSSFFEVKGESSPLYSPESRFYTCPICAQAASTKLPVGQLTTKPAGYPTPLVQQKRNGGTLHHYYHHLVTCTRYKTTCIMITIVSKAPPLATIIMFPRKLLRQVQGIVQGIVTAGLGYKIKDTARARV